MLGVEVFGNDVAYALRRLKRKLIYEKVVKEVSLRSKGYVVGVIAFVRGLLRAIANVCVGNVTNCGSRYLLAQI